MMTGKRRTLYIVLAVLIVAIACAAIWLGDIYHASADVESYTAQCGDVVISEIADGLFLDGPGSENALIFYPGAKVEYTAYAPLMAKLAQGGVDVFLIKMPCNLAVLGMNRADGVLSDYSYEHWYMGGHSLGGAMAADYIAQCLKKGKTTPEGLILLAAYPNKSLKDASVRVLTIYGSEDGVLNRKRLASGRALLPDTATEIIIEGGNHAQFGCYGVQKGDGNASISQEEQWQQTAQAILQWIAE